MGGVGWEPGWDSGALSLLVLTAGNKGQEPDPGGQGVHDPLL